MLKDDYYDLAEALLYFIDFACLLANDDWDFDLVEHFPNEFCDIGEISAEKVELVYNFINEHKEEINNDESLVANLLALEIATDGGGEGHYYELRAKDGCQTVSLIDLWSDIMEPLYDDDKDDEASAMITDIACNDADLWGFAQEHDLQKQIF